MLILNPTLPRRVLYSIALTVVCSIFFPLLLGVVYPYSSSRTELALLGRGDFVNRVIMLVELFLADFSSIIVPLGPGMLFSRMPSKSSRVLPSPVFPTL